MNRWEQQEQNKYAEITYLDQPQILDKKYVANFMVKVYGWMFLALAITALVAFYTASNESLISLLLGNKLLFYGILFGELLLVGYLAVRVHKMTSRSALLIFLLYAALNGVVFSLLLLIYEPQSIVVSFGITSITFGIMSVVGYTTKTDLTSFGKLMIMGLIGIIIASIVNMFMRNELLYWLISYAGVAIFVGLVAYDTQKIKNYAYLQNADDRKKGAIMGALALYLDFVNLFIFMLRLFGGRR